MNAPVINYRDTPDEMLTPYGKEQKEVQRRDELLEALRSIANNTCCDGCQEAALVASAALAKVRGEQP